MFVVPLKKEENDPVQLFQCCCGEDIDGFVDALVSVSKAGQKVDAETKIVGLASVWYVGHVCCLLNDLQMLSDCEESRECAARGNDFSEFGLFSCSSKNRRCKEERQEKSVQDMVSWQGEDSLRLADLDAGSVSAVASGGMSLRRAPWKVPEWRHARTAIRFFRHLRGIAQDFQRQSGVGV